MAGWAKGSRQYPALSVPRRAIVSCDAIRVVSTPSRQSQWARRRAGAGVISSPSLQSQWARHSSQYLCSTASGFAAGCCVRGWHPNSKPLLPILGQNERTNGQTRTSRQRRMGPLATGLGPRPASRCELRAVGAAAPRAPTRTDDLHSITSPPGPNPTRAGASATGAAALANESDSGGDAVEAIADLLSIARLLPGHDHGAGYGVATAPRQRWHLAIRYFGLFSGPVAAANATLTNERSHEPYW